MNFVIGYGKAGFNCLLYATSAVLSESYVNGTSHDGQLYLPTPIYSNWPVNKYSKQQTADLEVGKTVLRGTAFRDSRV